MPSAKSAQVALVTTRDVWQRCLLAAGCLHYTLGKNTLEVRRQLELLTMAVCGVCEAAPVSMVCNELNRPGDSVRFRSVTGSLSGEEVGGDLLPVSAMVIGTAGAGLMVGLGGEGLTTTHPSASVGVVGPGMGVDVKEETSRDCEMDAHEGAGAGPMVVALAFVVVGVGISRWIAARYGGDATPLVPRYLQRKLEAVEVSTRCKLG
jgi:hypothetical protein